MLPHDDYLMHFNKNHDPRNGQFTKGPGGSSSAKTNQPKKKMNPTLKKVLIGAGIATGVAAAATGAYFISKHFNKKNSITKTVDNLNKIKFTRKASALSFLEPDAEHGLLRVDDEFMNKQGEVFIKGINKNGKINKHKLTGYKSLKTMGRHFIDGKFEEQFMGSGVGKNGEWNVYNTMPGDIVYRRKNGMFASTSNFNIKYSNDIKKIGNAVVKKMLVKRELFKQ